MSYIAAAAEGERNRRLERESLDKRLDMQKYGIDTSAETAANRLTFDEYKFGEQEKRDDWTHDRLVTKTESMDDISKILLDNIDQQNLHTRDLDKYRELREEQRPSLWQAINPYENYASWKGGSGWFGGDDPTLGQWAGGLRDRIFEGIGLGVDPEDAVGPASYGSYNQGTFKGLSPDELTALLTWINKMDPGAIKNTNTTNLLNAFPNVSPNN